MDTVSGWDWKEFCGREEFAVWNPKFEDLDLCFQLVTLRIPVLGLIAIVSAYYAGLQSGGFRRSRREKWILRFRYTTALCLSALPVVQTYATVSAYPGSLYIVEYLAAAVACPTWLVHFLYIVALTRRIAVSLRGPVLLGVLWTANFILSCVKLHSDYLVYTNPSHCPVSASGLPFVFSIVEVVLQSVYLVTLLPSEDSRLNYEMRVNIQNRSGEQSPLFGVYSHFREDLDPGFLGVAMDGWSFPSRFLFSWVKPLMEKGVAGKLQNQEELYELPENLSSSYLYMKLGQALIPKHIYVTPSSKVSLLKALHLCFWKEFYGVGVLKFAADISGFCGPVLLHALVTYIENKNESTDKGYLYAFGLFAVAFVGAVCIPHFNFLMTVVGLKIRGALISAVYRKIITLSSVSLSKFSTGEIVNFMSTDMDRIVNSCASFHAFWSIPLQIAVTLYLLYQQVGLAFLAGVAFTLLLIPINKYIASNIGKLSTKMMDSKDQRIMIMTEILRGIRAIKLYSWEEFFTGKISEVRKKELKYLGGRKYLDALCVYFWATTPVLISILTFVTYTYMGHTLTAPIVFTSIALLNMLISPLNAFPWVLNGLTEAWVSLKRVERLLELSDVEPEEYYIALPNSVKAGTIIICDGNFHWGESDFKLSSINFCAQQGQLVAITGPVGSGKSSLLSAILAELEKTSGSVACADFDQGFGYVSQTPWLQRGTIQENILFGEPFNRERYWEVLEACDLVADLERFPKRDYTGIGEGGSTLSGGQKARIALARAVYQNHSVYLLDDILSSVDPHVAKHIFKHCICGLLKGKTRIMCTHQTNLLVHVDSVVVLENGIIKKQGPPDEVLTNYMDLVVHSELDSDEVSKKIEERESELDPMETQDAVLVEEESSRGSLEFQVYGMYFLSIGVCLTPLILLSIVLMQASRNFVDWWLAFWVSHENGTVPKFGSLFEANANTNFYLTVYVMIAGFNTVFTLLRAFLFAYGGLVAAKRIHNKLLDSIIKAKIRFFDTSPLGRILNRFSSDLYTIDDSLPFILNILLAQFFGLIGILVMTLYGLPWLCLILAPLVPVYHWLQNHYRLTSRELKRLSSVTLSPLYNHFNETIQGLVTIRAFRSVPRFKRDNACFLEANQKSQLSSSAASQWLGLRLQFIGVAMITGVGLLAVLQHQLDVVNPGLIGLAISYALSLTGSLGGVVNAFTETEREMIAVERVGQYCSDHDQGPSLEYFKYSILPPFAWPSQGVVTFTNVFVRYREHLPYALRNVSFSTRPAERIGIVGRTGAGKSTLIAAIFRLFEVSEGSITIDAVNTKLIGLKELRSRLGVIPQEPFIFEGSVRSNVDPHDRHTDTEIWKALGNAHLSTVVTAMGGLTTIVKNNSLSVGQKQLLCLARAILQNAKVICIDEATANVDEETDRLIQKTLKTSFIQSTVLTIAHRVRTIMDSDRVLVMGDGQVIEFDSPSALLQNRNSHFYQLSNEHENSK